MHKDDKNKNRKHWSSTNTFIAHDRPWRDHNFGFVCGIWGVYGSCRAISACVHSFLDVLIWISFSICISFVQTFVLHLLSVSYQEMKHFWCTCRCVLKKVDNQKVLQRPGNKLLFFIRRKSIENYTPSNKERRFGVVMRTRLTWIGNKYLSMNLLWRTINIPYGTLICKEVHIAKT